MNRVEILPEILWQHTESLLSESKIPVETRYSKVNLDLSVDDVIRLFLVTVEDSLSYEITTLIKNNVKLANKEVIERTIVDDRFDRLIEILKSFGITNTALYCHINLMRDQYFHKLQDINEKILEAKEVLEVEKDKQELFKLLESEDDDIAVI